MRFSATGHVIISSRMTCRGRMSITADSDKDGQVLSLLAALVYKSTNTDT